MGAPSRDDEEDPGNESPAVGRSARSDTHGPSRDPAAGRAPNSERDGAKGAASASTSSGPACCRFKDASPICTATVACATQVMAVGR